MTQHDALLRHFTDLRDGRHGSAVGRAAKERVFVEATRLLDPVARRALAELDEELLLGGGEIAFADGRTAEGGLAAEWRLSWAEQVAAGVGPVIVSAHYGRTFHHPHLRGATVGDWPLNVFDAEQAAEQLPTLRAIVAADLHNLVFQADYRIVPAMFAAGTGPVAGHT